jgi:glucan 1,3-beta-glucosidase
LLWARKYGLRINLDLHAVPGSQKFVFPRFPIQVHYLRRLFLCSGWNHSGRLGSLGFMNGGMGIANAQRTLNVIRALAEFISLPGNNEVGLALSTRTAFADGLKS